MGLFGDFDRDKRAAERALEAALFEAHFSLRTAHAILYGRVIKTIEELRTRPWGDRRAGGTLACELGRLPNMGPKGLAEVVAFREGKDPKTARPPGDVSVTTPFPPGQLAALDEWIALQPKPISRQEAIRAFVAAGLHLMGKRG